MQVFCKKNVKNLQKRFFPYICCMEKLTHGSLFSGIGGFDLAAEWMGWENKFHCEWNEFGQKVLHHYWPEAECFTDITKSDFKKYYGKIDILTGGFPCQPYSSAGKRKGKEDERHLFLEISESVHMRHRRSGAAHSKIGSERVPDEEHQVAPQFYKRI